MNGKFALVVHPELETARRVSEALGDAGLKVMAATSDADALARLGQFFVPDVVVTGLDPSHQDGSLVLGHLRENPLTRHVPAVVLTSGEPEERRRGLRLGVTYMVPPPYDGEELVLNTRLALERHRDQHLLTGSLEQLPVTDLLQTAETARRTGIVTLRGGGRTGTLWLRDGRIVDAEIDDGRRGKEAVLALALWQEGAFEADFRKFAAGEVEAPTLSFDFEFPFRHGAQKVHIGFVRSPLDKEIIVTVNRVRALALTLSAEIRHDAAGGRLRDAAGATVVVADPDFWRALESLYDNREPDERRAELHRLGMQWGLHHALRVEGFVQSQHRRTLREVELQVALESLSGSIGVLGLGRFDVDLAYRERGLLLVEHHGSPFAAILSERDATRCDLLAGLHAGFLSYVSGRRLAAREITCSQAPGAACRFVVGTERRLARLFDPVAGSVDAHLLVALGVRVRTAGDRREPVHG